MNASGKGITSTQKSAQLVVQYPTNWAKMTNPRVFFDINVGNRTSGRITFELFADVVPKTAENFRCLCTGEKGSSPTSRLPLHFKNSQFHRIIPGFMAQGGDFTRGDGTGGESVWGPRFADENFRLKHDRPHLLSMANAGPNTNGSQFFITFAPAPWLDGKHVVFGRVVDGASLIMQMERVVTGANDRPRAPITITDCGVCKVAGDLELSSSARIEALARAAEERLPPAATSSTAAVALSRGGRGANIAGAIADAGLPLHFGKQKPLKPGSRAAVAAEAASETHAMSMARLVQQQMLEQHKAAAAVRDAAVIAAAALAAATGSADDTEAVADGEEAGEATASRGEAPSLAQASSSADVRERDDAAVQEGGDAASSTTRSHLQDKLFQLRLKMNSGRRENFDAVIAEHRRSEPAPKLQDRRREPDGVPRVIAAEKKAGKPAQEAEAQAASGDASEGVAGSKRRRPAGEDESAGAVDGAAVAAAPPPLPTVMYETALHAEKKSELAAEKEERKLGSYGWNASNEDASYRAYSKRLAALPGASAGGGSGAPIVGPEHVVKAPVVPGGDLLACVGMDYGRQDYVDPAGVQRMAAQMSKDKELRQGFHRRRLTNDEDGVDYINEKNRKFVRKIAQEYDKYAVGIKQSLERGTAL